MCDKESTIKALINHDILIWARENRGFSIEHSAKEIGISPETLKQWEAGGDLTIKDLRKVAEVYEIDMAAFYLKERPDLNLYNNNPDVYAEFEDILDRVRKNILDGIQKLYKKDYPADCEINRALCLLGQLVDAEIEVAIEDIYTDVEEEG